MDLVFGSLFAGIGGIDLALESVGMRCAWQVEMDPYATKVLERHWPDVPKWRDIRDFKPTSQQRVDLICGGFPCQDISLAGTGDGINGSRSGLWSEYFRIISVLRPRYVLVENSSAITGRGGLRVLRDLASLGYAAEWQTLRASDFALPHRRERVCIVAYPDSIIRSECEGLGLIEDGPQEIFGADAAERFAVRVKAADRFVGMDDGLTRESYGHRAERIGNCVAVPCFEWVARRIVEFDQRLRGDA